MDFTTHTLIQICPHIHILTNPHTLSHTYISQRLSYAYILARTYVKRFILDLDEVDSVFLL